HAHRRVNARHEGTLERDSAIQTATDRDVTGRSLDGPPLGFSFAFDDDQKLHVEYSSRKGGYRGTPPLPPGVLSYAFTFSTSPLKYLNFSSARYTSPGAAGGTA